MGLVENRFKERRTKWGWTIKSMDDLILAILGYPYFQTVASCFVKEAVESAINDRAEWNDVEEFVGYIAEMYI